tara:strand:- start:12 stop:470 length:459 start_codon:yes stop_codon:yes gene_type:complete
MNYGEENMSQINNSKNVARGEVGEYLALAELNLNQILAHKVSKAPYDIIIDANNSLIKVQVKVGHCPKDWRKGKIRYDSVRFRTYKGSKGKSKYNKNEVDLFAFVDIDTKSIAWVHFNETYKTGLRIKKKDFINYNIDRILSLYFSNKNKGE